MHRLRESTGKRDDLYQFEDVMEFDERYFPTETSKKLRSDLKREKGSQCENNVAVMSESAYLEDMETGKVSKQYSYFKMQVLDTHKSEGEY